MSLETLLDGPHLSWSREDSATCTLDVMLSAVKAGIPLGPEMGNALRAGDWGLLPLMLPEGTAERQALEGRILSHRHWQCEEPESGLPCADWRGDADQFLRDKVKAYEDATGVPVTAVAHGNDFGDVEEVFDVLEVPELTLQTLAEYVALLHEAPALDKFTYWALHEPTSEGALFCLEVEYVDTAGETRYEHAPMYPLNAEQERVYHQWRSHFGVEVTPKDIQTLSTANPEDYPLLRALPGHIKRRSTFPAPEPTWRANFRRTFEEARRYLAGLTPTEQEVFLTLLPDWEGPLEELVNPSKSVTADALHTRTGTK